MLILHHSFPLIATTLEGCLYARMYTARVSVIIVFISAVYSVVNAVASLVRGSDVYPIIPWNENMMKSVLLSIGLFVTSILMLWGFVAAKKRKLEADLLNIVHDEQE